MATVQTAPEMSLSSAPMAVPQNKDLDLMAITMAALRLVNPWTAKAEPSSWEEPSRTSQDPKERVISLAEVSQHDSARDCWVVIYDRVYDISTFFDEHPGGADIMLEWAGQDASTAFRSSGHSRVATKALERFLVGELPMAERMYRRPGGFRLSDIPE